MDDLSAPFNRFQSADIILEYIDRPEHKNQMFDVDSLQKVLFPDTDIETIEFLMTMISSPRINPPVAVLVGEQYLMKTANTKQFLNDGGFTRINDEKLAKEQKDAHQKDIEFEKSKIDLELSKKVLKDYKQTKWMSRIAFAISIVLAIIEIFKWIKGK